MKMSNSKLDYPKSVIKFGETILKWADSYKYLGIEVHSNGNMMTTSENLCSRAWKAVFKMKSAFKDIDVNPKLQIKMFDMKLGECKLLETNNVEYTIVHCQSNIACS